MELNLFFQSHHCLNDFKVHFAYNLFLHLLVLDNKQNTKIKNIYLPFPALLKPERRNKAGIYIGTRRDLSMMNKLLQ